jgi:uncharacterized protein
MIPRRWPKPQASTASATTSRSATQPYDALEGADALVVVTEWKAFWSPDFRRIARSLKSPGDFRRPQHLGSEPGRGGRACLLRHRPWSQPSSLRDQLTQLGFKPADPRQAARAGARRRGSACRQAGRARPPNRACAGPGRRAGVGQGRQVEAPSPERAVGDDSRSQEEIDLAKAYALRQRVEREEQQRLERERQAEAARRREARQKLHTLLQSASLNHAAAELPRHFEHAGKIRRIYVTPEQLKALNAGELAVVRGGWSLPPGRAWSTPSRRAR